MYGFLALLMLALVVAVSKFDIETAAPAVRQYSKNKGDQIAETLLRGHSAGIEAARALVFTPGEIFNPVYPGDFQSDWITQCRNGTTILTAFSGPVENGNFARVVNAARSQWSGYDGLGYSAGGTIHGPAALRFVLPCPPPVESAFAVTVY